ncbi:protein of unknown function [Methylobacillus rhizosphaerae]|uniref:DarT domain-containing protein n=1 Tax=Methylobacillus rhizosphaerae TaxID=551994 RepID=A0A238XVP7_9PROT|nr:DUF4433 domain-containing protein [Methylobacillus rhizosphaerae]SNR63116.1 protein of unknown function [Methylobacillus rhizosphaerae]
MAADPKTFLTPEKAHIFRITHKDNIPWILRNGLYCSTAGVQDPNFVPIGNPSLIVSRTTRQLSLPPGGALADYVPFYFTPYSPMFLNILSGRNGLTRRSQEEICILISSLGTIKKNGLQFMFSDRHAKLDLANFSNRFEDLGMISWDDLQNRDFKRNPEFPEKFERYQAEALVHRHVPIKCIDTIVTYTTELKDAITQEVARVGCKTNVAKVTGLYF